MMVFWEQRLVVLATPKTGSTALASALESRAALISKRPPEVKHTTAARYQWLVRPFLEKSTRQRFTVVALMREPVDWLGSWYRFRQRRSDPPPRNSTVELSFDQFVEGYIATPRAPFADVGSQVRFLYNQDKLAVDLLFDYAEMPHFLAYLQDRLGVIPALARENVSPEAKLTLSPDLLARLQQAVPDDFRLYDRVRRGRTGEPAPRPGPQPAPTGLP